MLPIYIHPCKCFVSQRMALLPFGCQLPSCALATAMVRASWVGWTRQTTSRDNTQRGEPRQQQSTLLSGYKATGLVCLLYLSHLPGAALDRIACRADMLLSISSRNLASRTSTWRATCSFGRTMDAVVQTARGCGGVILAAAMLSILLHTCMVRCFAFMEFSSTHLH